ncbi:Phosphate-selective porin O and P [Planctomycetes bacterium MalM25]|nr:Phosphate-selective porin O and P [Planctomycetes bacterium MalM25]
MSSRLSLTICLALTLAPLCWSETPQRLPPIDAGADSDAVIPVVYEPLVGCVYEGERSPCQPRYEVGALFDKGLFIRGTDPQRDPYSLYIGARLQLRHTGFTRDAESWTDSAGVTRTIRNRNQFEAERLRLNLSGTAIDPDLSYYLIFDGDSDGGSNVDQLAYLVTYAFDDALKLRLGRWKAASDREWLMSSRFLSLVDRSMATEYFRAGFTDGVWVLGDLGDGWHYETSLTNGLRTSTRPSFSLDDNLAAAATVYVDPLGPYGSGFADYACHETPVLRIGGSFAFDKSDDRSDAGFPLGDDGFLRLSDGTRLSEVGALGPGVQLLGDRLLKGGIDVAMKYRGWSVSAEWFVRSIQDLTADGPITVSQIDDHGYRCDVGVFLIPKRLDAWTRVSHVSGSAGDAYEYAAGFNYYWGSGQHEGELDDRVNKFSFDVTSLDGSPVTSGPADLIAGDDGVLFRTQVQVGF